MSTRKLILEVTVDWEDYDDVSDELLLEDVTENWVIKDGTDVKLINGEQE